MALSIRCSSLAEHAAYSALSDIASLRLAKSRLIGGQMVALHVHRYRLDLLRETSDADLGLQPFVLKSSNIGDQLESIGYRMVAGNRFVRDIKGMTLADGSPLQATIDLLVPSTTSRVRESVQHGRINTTEVAGLSLAFQRDAVDVDLDVGFLDGTQAAFGVSIPDEVAALALKVLARSVRRTDRDAIDVWRCLEVCAAADVGRVHFGSEHKQVVEILDTEFVQEGDGLFELANAQNLSREQTVERHTRIRALIANLELE